MTGTETDVLVVGAGPSGLALALQACDHGARVRVVERRTQAFRPSRALIVHPRTLEVLRPLGVTDSLLARGDASPSVRLHLGRREITVTLGEFAIDDTAFPFLLFLAQADVEDVLNRALAARGIHVEYEADLQGLRTDATGTVAELCRAGRPETVHCRYLAGCDGSTSTVRRLAGIDWPGGAYRQEAVIADVELDGHLASREAHAVAGRHGVLFLFALGEQATWRVLVTRRATRTDRPAGQPTDRVSRRELQGLLDDAGLTARIASVAWSARVSLQHRLAAHYRSGPLFLVGDAAHVHSPAGGQGMNTGIQDATNLGWKLAFAAATLDPSDPVADGLLDTYEAERRPVDRRVLALTHAIFWAEASTGRCASFVRGTLVPLTAPVVPTVLRRRRLTAGGVRILSQLSTRYRPGTAAIEADRTGRPRPRPRLRPGTRLPDRQVELHGGTRRLHEVVARPGIHLLLEQSAPAFDTTPLSDFVHVRRICSWPGAGAIAVRPDGYIGCVDDSTDLHRVGDWLAQVYPGGRR